MKKLQSLFLCVLSVLIISCNKDDDDTSLTEANLIGTWEMTEFYIKDGKITGLTNGRTIDIPGLADGETVSGNFSLTSENFNNLLTFADNPKEVTANGSLTTTISISILGEIVYKQTDTFTIREEKSSWSLQDNVITMDTDKFEIISFDNNILRLSTTLPETFLLGLNLIGSQHITFVKQ